MVTCPRCGRAVDDLHLLPPAVITHDLLEVMGGADAANDVRACRECSRDLMAGG